jgi:hypothetical protein
MEALEDNLVSTDLQWVVDLLSAHCGIIGYKPSFRCNVSTLGKLTNESSPLSAQYIQDLFVRCVLSYDPSEYSSLSSQDCTRHPSAHTTIYCFLSIPIKMSLRQHPTSNQKCFKSDVHSAMEVIIATHIFASTLESLPSCWCSCSCIAAMGLVSDPRSFVVSAT